MRDRREVLKLLAGGTAAAAGASLITTSTAFADGGSPQCQPDVPLTSGVTWAIGTGVTLGSAVTLTSTPTRASFITLTFNSAPSVPNAACKDCHPNTTETPQRFIKWVVTGGPSGNSGVYGIWDTSATGTGNNYATFRRLDTTGTANTSVSLPTTYYLRHTTSATNSTNVVFPANSTGTFTVRLSVQWLCTYSWRNTTRTAWKCTSFAWTLTLTDSSGNDPTVPTSATRASTFQATPGPDC